MTPADTAALKAELEHALDQAIDVQNTPGYRLTVGAALNAVLPLVSRLIEAVGEQAYANVTRLEVIGEAGRDYTRWDCVIEPSWQDNGRTLKLFVAPRALAVSAPTREQE